MTGYTKIDALGQNLVEKFIDEDSKASVREVLRKALVDGSKGVVNQIWKTAENKPGANWAKI